MTNPIEDLRAWAQRIGESAPAAHQVHCGRAIWEWLRDMARPPGPNMLGVPVPDLFGVPVIVHDDWHRGLWQLRTGDGEVTRFGQVGEPDEQVHYIPGRGFAGLRVDLTDPPAAGSAPAPAL